MRTRATKWIAVYGVLIFPSNGFVVREGILFSGQEHTEPGHFKDQFLFYG
ncbi:hypothetical protein [Bacillus sp. Bos-x628]